MVTQTIGSNTSCGPTDEVCNGPLRPDTEYQFKYRAYTSDDPNSFVESMYSGAIRTGMCVCVHVYVCSMYVCM